MGTPLLLPQPDPHPARMLETPGNQKDTPAGGQAAGQTDGQGADGQLAGECEHTDPMTTKQLIFQGGGFFFFFVCFFVCLFPLKK